MLSIIFLLGNRDTIAGQETISGCRAIKIKNKKTIDKWPEYNIIIENQQFIMLNRFTKFIICMLKYYFINNDSI